MSLNHGGLCGAEILLLRGAFITAAPDLLHQSTPLIQPLSPALVLGNRCRHPKCKKESPYAGVLGALTGYLQVTFI